MERPPWLQHALSLLVFPEETCVISSGHCGNQIDFMELKEIITIDQKLRSIRLPHSISKDEVVYFHFKNCFEGRGLVCHVE